MDWRAKDEWEAWLNAMADAKTFMVAMPDGLYGLGELEHGNAWSDWRARAYFQWYHVPIVRVGETDYDSLADAIAAGRGRPIDLLVPSVADWTDERVSLRKNEWFSIVVDADHVLGYVPELDIDDNSWKLVVSRSAGDGDTKIETYKAVGPGTVLLLR